MRINTLPSDVLSAQVARGRPGRATITHVAALPLDEPATATRPPEVEIPITPILPGDRSGNPMRPTTLNEMVGQSTLKPLLRRIIDVSIDTGRPLSHLLMIGGAGTGKTTTAHVVANEIGTRYFELEAPVSAEYLLALRKIARDGDVVFIDEIHQQSRGDRRGKVASMEPEAMYRLLEDFEMVVGGQVLPFPRVTVVGATTDPGLLPEAFLARFPLQPRLTQYSDEEMTELARRNARAIDVRIDERAASIFGAAARCIPRLINRYMQNARSLTTGGISAALAEEVVTMLNGTTLDGLNPEMQRMLTYLLSQGREVKGEIRYQASAGSVATALGLSRDAKAVALHVEPYLIQRGLVQVVHGGRTLTPAGIARASQLS